MFAWRLIIYCASGGHLCFATTRRERKSPLWFIRSCVYALPSSTQFVFSRQMYGESLSHTLDCKVPHPRDWKASHKLFWTWENRDDRVACFQTYVHSLNTGSSPRVCISLVQGSNPEALSLAHSFCYSCCCWYGVTCMHAVAIHRSCPNKVKIDQFVSTHAPQTASLSADFVQRCGITLFASAHGTYALVCALSSMCFTKSPSFMAVSLPKNQEW